MKRFLMFLFLILMVLPLTGCLSSFSGLGDGRMDAWKDVRVAEEKTFQEEEKTEQARLNFKSGARLKQNPTLKLTSYDAEGNVTGQAEMDLQPMFAELGLDSGKGKATHRPKTPIPKGQIAESFDSVGNIVEKVGDAPAVIAGVTARGIREALKESGGGPQINGESIVKDGSFNDIESHATGSGNTADGSFVLDKSTTEFAPPPPEPAL